MLCPQLEDKDVLEDFNSIIRRLGGEDILPKEIVDRKSYINRLSKDNIRPYHQAYYLWDKHNGDMSKIGGFVDAVEAVKLLLKKRPLPDRKELPQRNHQNHPKKRLKWATRT